MTAVQYDEPKDFADRKVNIQVLVGELRNNVHLNHLYSRHASLARASMKMWRLLNGHAAINGANMLLCGTACPAKPKECSSATEIF